MPFSYTYRLLVVLGTVSLVVLLNLFSFVHAETKTIVSEATYSMGDGETPSFAEAMVLQKAKQRALEEAGTYVESYTQVRNLDLTVDEIKTIAGGVMKTEIVEQNREQLKGNGLRFYVKISSLVTTDNLEDLARRIRGGNLASENKRLQDAIADLTKDLDLLKQQVPETKTESEREVVLDKIRDIEKQFREVLSTENAFYKRLVSGEELVAKAEREFQNEQRRREEEQRRKERLNNAFEQLLRTVRDNGHMIEIGPPEIKVSVDRPETVTLRFLVTATVTDEAKASIRELRKVGSNDLTNSSYQRIEELLNSLTLVLTVVLKDGGQYVKKQRGFHNYISPRSYDLMRMAKEAPRSEYFSVDIPRHSLGEVISIEGRISP
jgi:hypothetical protein